MPSEHTGLQFYNQGKSWVKRRTTFCSFLSDVMSRFYHPLFRQIEKRSFLVPVWSSKVHKLLFLICAESMS